MSFTLNSGEKIPEIGLGTFNFFKSGEVGPAVVEALRQGYRLIDCAHYYDNEEEIGDALQKCFKEGIVKREDIFVTSKLWCACKWPEDIVKACKLSLKNLQLDYLDLYLNHWPITLAKCAELPFKNDDHKLGYDPDHEAKCWEKLEECMQRGLVKSIGISNYSITKMERLLQTAKIVPAVNQVECHPYFQQPKLKAYCDSKGIVMQCYYPLGGKKRDEVFKNSTIAEIAGKHAATVAQVCIGFNIHRGCSVIPKSVNAARIVENFNSANLQLDEEDMKCLKGMDKNSRFLPGKHLLRDGENDQEVMWDTSADAAYVNS